MSAQTLTCDHCGACCKGTLIVEAYDLDVLREPRIHDADVSGNRPEIEDLCEGGKCIVLAGISSCKFIGQDNRCSIYPTRPNACVGMEAGGEQCQSSRRALGLPPLQPLQPRKET